MTPNAFVCQCIVDTVEGLSDGLSHFSGPSRVAVLYAISVEDPIAIYDPQDLLHGHEPILKERYLDNDNWRCQDPSPADKKSFRNLQPLRKLDLAGLISYGARSGSVCHQMWFTEHHAEMSSTGPTERWLEHAAWRFSHDIVNEPDLYTGISGNFLREYATHAVRDTIVDEMNIRLGWDTQLRIYPILDAVLGISRTAEEGAWARGKLRFVEAGSMTAMPFLARFPVTERPYLAHHKHVRKLLTSVENSDRVLVSDGQTLVGIAQNDLPPFSITADFRGGHGFLHLNTDPLCSFADGRFHSKTYQAKLVQVEEALLESDLTPAVQNTLFKIIAAIVHNAENTKYGCTLVIDLNPEPLRLSGQKLETPVDLQLVGGLQMAQSLSKVDGALHIGKDMHLHGFACLLDGMAIAGEDRARGARYNSALRFTTAHQNILVIVVSSDRPVSIIQEGVELNALCPWRPATNCALMPLSLKEALSD